MALDYFLSFILYIIFHQSTLIHPVNTSACAQCKLYLGVFVLINAFNYVLLLHDCTIHLEFESDLYIGKFVRGDQGSMDFNQINNNFTFFHFLHDSTARVLIEILVHSHMENLVFVAGHQHRSILFSHLIILRGIIIISIIFFILIGFLILFIDKLFIYFILIYPALSRGVNIFNFYIIFTCIILIILSFFRGFVAIVGVVPRYSLGRQRTDMLDFRFILDYFINHLFFGDKTRFYTILRDKNFSDLVLV